MIRPEAPAVVIGVGNVLLGDDGVGVRVVEALRDAAAKDPSVLPAATRLVDGGTLGTQLLDVIARARSLLLLDALDLGRPAGTVSVLRDDGIAAAGAGPGRPDGGEGVNELLGVARLAGWLPATVVLVGIQVDDMSPGIGLSKRVEAAVPVAVEAARRELWVLDAVAEGMTA